MTTIKTTYLGDLRTKATHIQSGTEILTDAPVDNQGKGEAFSPTDLVAASLGSCMMTIMGIVANRENLDLRGMSMDITKIMTSTPPRAIAKIEIKFDFYSIKLDENQRIKLKNAALTCPVSLSLDGDIIQDIDFGW